MYLGVSSSLAHISPEDWAAKHKALGLKTVNFPVDFTAGEGTADTGRTFRKISGKWQ